VSATQRVTLYPAQTGGNLTSYPTDNPVAQLGAPPMVVMMMGAAPFWQGAFAISGVTRTAAGAPLGNCVVELYVQATNMRVDIVISDSGGNFTFPGLANNVLFYIVASNSNSSPELTGTTIRELVAS